MDGAEVSPWPSMSHTSWQHNAAAETTTHSTSASISSRHQHSTPLGAAAQAEEGRGQGGMTASSTDSLLSGRVPDMRNRQPPTLVPPLQRATGVSAAADELMSPSCVMSPWPSTGYLHRRDERIMSTEHLNANMINSNMSSPHPPTLAVADFGADDGYHTQAMSEQHGQRVSHALLTPPSPLIKADIGRDAGQGVARQASGMCAVNDVMHAQSSPHAHDASPLPQVRQLTPPPHYTDAAGSEAADGTVGVHATEDDRSRVAQRRWTSRPLHHSSLPPPYNPQVL